MNITPINKDDSSPIFCVRWHHTLFRIVADGLEIRCKSCRGEIHHISRERIEQEWDALNRVREPIIKIAS